MCVCMLIECGRYQFLSGHFKKNFNYNNFFDVSTVRSAQCLVGLPPVDSSCCGIPPPPPPSPSYKPHSELLGSFSPSFLPSFSFLFVVVQVELV